MKKKAKKIILISFVALLLFGAAAGYYLYNKGPVDVKRSKAVTVHATELYSLFSSDSLKAKEKFTAKVLLVHGEVTEVSVNSKLQKIVLLKTGIDGAYVNCTLEEPDESIVFPGPISVKGICSGIGEGDADLGIPGDVYLTRCIVSTK
jgi:tRNA_anti-like